MDTTVSRDGTRIAYERAGSGPAIVFVPGYSTITPGARSWPPRWLDRPHGDPVRPARPRRERRHPAVRDRAGGRGPGGADRAVRRAGDACSATRPGRCWRCRRRRTASRSRAWCCSSRRSRSGDPWPPRLPGTAGGAGRGRAAGDAVATVPDRGDRPAGGRRRAHPAVADVAGTGGDGAEHGLRRDDQRRAGGAHRGDDRGDDADTDHERRPDVAGAARRGARLAKLMPGARHLEVPAANHDIPTAETAAALRTP